MSNVTNVILVSARADRHNIDRINDQVQFRGGIGLVSCIDDDIEYRTWGGDADIGVSVAVGACGELKLDALIAVITRLEWSAPETVQLLVCGPDDERFEEIAVTIRAN